MASSSTTFIRFHYEKTPAAFCIFLTHPIALDFYSILLNVEIFFLQASGSFSPRLAPAGGLVGGERGQGLGSAGPRAYVVRINMPPTVWERDSLTGCLCLGGGSS